MGSHFLLQGILLTQRLNLHLHCRQILYLLSHQDSTDLKSPKLGPFTRGTQAEDVHPYRTTGLLFLAWTSPIRPQADDGPKRAWGVPVMPRHSTLGHTGLHIRAYVVPYISASWQHSHCFTPLSHSLVYSFEVQALLSFLVDVQKPASSLSSSPQESRSPTLLLRHTLLFPLLENLEASLSPHFWPILHPSLPLNTFTMDTWWCVWAHFLDVPLRITTLITTPGRCI